jgi:hypothetical protein
MQCNPRGQFKNRNWFLPTLHISIGIVALFEKIYGEAPILTVFQPTSFLIGQSIPLIRYQGTTWYLLCMCER